MILSILLSVKLSPFAYFTFPQELAAHKIIFILIEDSSLNIFVVKHTYFGW